jgi:hypothetical protein
MPSLASKTIVPSIICKEELAGKSAAVTIEAVLPPCSRTTTVTVVSDEVVLEQYMDLTIDVVRAGAVYNVVALVGTSTNEAFLYVFAIRVILQLLL